MNEELYMQRALQLAEKGKGSVSPNPLVGCVIVAENKIIGEGYHQKYGEAHAEVNAMNSISDKNLLSKSTVYVTLEPCSHFGKTPPCVDALIKANVKKVVIATLDPNPLVAQNDAGRGIQKLKDAGIEDFLNSFGNIDYPSKIIPYLALHPKFLLFYKEFLSFIKTK